MKNKWYIVEISQSFSGGSEGPEICVKNKIAQLRKSVPCVIKTILQQQQDIIVATVDCQSSC